MMIVVCVAMMGLMVFGGMHHGMTSGTRSAGPGVAPTNHSHAVSDHDPGATP